INGKGLGVKSRNNILSVLKMTVKYLTNLDNTIWKTHPCVFIKKLPTTSSKHTAYSDEQIKMIKDAILKTGDTQLLLFIEFIYYCFTRPGTEARLIQIEHLEKDRLFIPSVNSKNRMGDWVSIPLVFQRKLIKMNLQQYPGSYFLFSNAGVPGELPVGKNYFYKRFKMILDETGLSKSSFRYDIYGFKHSGNINMYNSGLPLDIIQKQNRHQSIDQTNQYLRDLDLFRTSDAFDNVKSF
ncbi:MAG: site-specific integrase, partial [Cyclobacteriaceae bacterium]|nr:site-specific integrase [Cyclobacteriaceae bacterium]